MKYWESNGRSNRYMIHLTCSRHSLKWNFVVFDVLKYFDLTKSEFFLTFCIMLVSYCAGLSGHTIQPTSWKNAYPSSNIRRHIRRYWPCAAWFLLYPDSEPAVLWWHGIQYTGILQ